MQYDMPKIRPTSTTPNSTKEKADIFTDKRTCPRKELVDLFQTHGMETAVEVTSWFQKGTGLDEMGRAQRG